MRDFEIIPYKEFTLYEFKDDKSVTWSDSGGYLDCCFDSVDTAKFFIDIDENEFIDNIYTIIGELQKTAIQENKGLVTKEMINKHRF